MYQLYGDTFTITVNDWIAAGLTYNQFNHDSKEKKLSIVDRRINGNTLIDVMSIRRADRRAAIEAAYGSIDRLKKTVNPTEMHLDIDEAAKAFYRNYTYTNAEGKVLNLPEARREQYTNEASILNFLLNRYKIRSSARAAQGKKLTKSDYYADCVAAAEAFKKAGYYNELPSNTRRFAIKFEQYRITGLDSLIHAAYGNSHAQKLTEDAKFWVVARYATPVNKITITQLFNEYNREAIKHEGWNHLDSEQTIYTFLNRPDIKQLWYGSRYGELHAKEKYTRQHQTILPQRRDSLWYGDGTKLNYYYRDEQGNVATCNVYEVIDAYSEVLLGYHISKSEDFEAQYYAYRMALQFSRHKPNEIRFDNQGGHKKLVAGEFFKKLAHLAIPTMPYNGRSKTIESAFGRFQAEFLHQDWFFTGQNVTTHKAESRANMEFILANKANLPTLDEVKRIYKQRRDEWNNAEHFDTGKPRLQMYNESVNDKTAEVDALDMIDVFGVIDPIANTYTASGIKKSIKGVEYCWEVLKDDGMPDLDFLRHNVDKRLYVGYDLNDMTMVALYEKTPQGDYRHVAMAQKYIKVHRAKQDQDEFDNAFLKATELANKAMRCEMQDNIESILEQYGMHPSQHGLNMPQPKGLNLTQKDGIGGYTKKVSQLVPTDILDNF